MFSNVLFPVVFAASQSLTISNIPQTVDVHQEMSVGVVFSCPSCSTDSYLRGVFYPSGSNYFGYTQNNSGSWVNASGSLCDLYYKVGQAELVSEGSWSGILKVKPDAGSTFYDGPGTYTFKIGRYTPSCGSPSVWSNEVAIAISGPTPTATLQATAAHTPTGKPSPTITAQPAHTTHTTPMPKETKMNTPMPSPISAILGSSEEVVTPTLMVYPSPVTVEVKGTGMVNPMAIAFAFIGSGLALLATALAWRKSRKWKESQNSG